MSKLLYEKKEAKKWGRENLTGCVPTMTTVFTEDGEVDYEGMRYNFRNILKFWEIIGEILKVPTYHFEVPTCNDERALDFLGSEMKRFISFLEEHTGRKLDVDRLREVVKESNKANEVYLEICEMKMV